MTKEKTETTALAVQDGNNRSMCSVFENFSIYEKAGECFAKTCMLGEITSSQGTVAAITMACEGLSPVQFKARWHLGKNGMLVRVTNSVLGDFQMDGGKWKINQADEDVCDITFYFGVMEFRSKVTMEKMLETKHPYCKESAYKAKNGKFLKDNWAEHGDDMLFARCCGKGLRRVWPKGMGGIYLKDEIEEDEQNFRTPKEVAVSDAKERIAKMALDGKTMREECERGMKNSPLAEQEGIENVAVVVADSNDSGICPIAGKLFGKPWAELDADTLQAALNQREKYHELTDAHIAAIEEELMKKGAQ